MNQREFIKNLVLAPFAVRLNKLTALLSGKSESRNESPMDFAKIEVMNKAGKWVDITQDACCIEDCFMINIDTYTPTSAD